MRTKFASSLLYAASLAAGVGCHHAAREADRAAPPGETQPAPPANPGLNRAVLLDGEAPADPKGASRLTIERQGGVRLGTGALEVYASLRNRTASPLQVEIRTRFFGAQQEPVEGPTGWQPLTLQPASIVTFKGRSLALSNVDYFIIEVREARE